MRFSRAWRGYDKKIFPGIRLHETQLLLLRIMNILGFFLPDFLRCDCGRAGGPSGGSFTLVRDGCPASDPWFYRHRFRFRYVGFRHAADKRVLCDATINRDECGFDRPQAQHSLSEKRPHLAILKRRTMI